LYKTGGGSRRWVRQYALLFFSEPWWSQWANTTEQSLAHAKKDLAEIERLLNEAKTQLESQD
jgi:hypothetical protein